MCCRLVKYALLMTSKFSNWIALVTHAAMLARSRYAPVKYTWKTLPAGQAAPDTRYRDRSRGFVFEKLPIPPSRT